MSKMDYLKSEVEHLSGQLVGVQASFDAIIGACLQTGALDPETLKFVLRSTAEVFPMNPNLRANEVNGATSFVTSVISTVETMQAASGKGGQ